MTNIFQSFINEVVNVEIAGNNVTSGTLIDVGRDVIVLFNGKKFVYIAMQHVKKMDATPEDDVEIETPSEFVTLITEEITESATFHEMLKAAVNTFTELHVSGGYPLQGVINRIMSDYLVFESPIYKTMFIPIRHIKWLSPFNQDEKLLGEDIEYYSHLSKEVQLADSFEEQFMKWIHQIIVLNIEGPKSLYGRVVQIGGQIAEVQNARGQSAYMNLHHIKAVHLV